MIPLLPAVAGNRTLSTRTCPQTGQSRGDSREKSREEWEKMRETIRGLYIEDGRNASEVVKILSDQHGFRVTYITLCSLSPCSVVIGC